MLKSPMLMSKIEPYSTTSGQPKHSSLMQYSFVIYDNIELGKVVQISLFIYSAIYVCGFVGIRHSSLSIISPEYIFIVCTSVIFILVILSISSSSILNGISSSKFSSYKHDKSNKVTTTQYSLGIRNQSSFVESLICDSYSQVECKYSSMSFIAKFI